MFDDPYTPSCVIGPDEGIILLGGAHDFPYPLEDYQRSLKDIQSFKKTQNKDRGRLLILSLIRKIFTMEDLLTKNVTGCTRDSISKKRIAIGKLDASKMMAIFDQASMQFPGFEEKCYDTKSNTVQCIQDLCKRMRSVNRYQSSSHPPL